MQFFSFCSTYVGDFCGDNQAPFWLLMQLWVSASFIIFSGGVSDLRWWSPTEACREMGLIEYKYTRFFYSSWLEPVRVKYIPFETTRFFAGIVAYLLGATALLLAMRYAETCQFIYYMYFEHGVNLLTYVFMSLVTCGVGLYTSGLLYSKILRSAMGISTGRTHGYNERNPKIGVLHCPMPHESRESVDRYLGALCMAISIFFSFFWCMVVAEFPHNSPITEFQVILGLTFLYTFIFTYLAECTGYYGEYAGYYNLYYLWFEEHMAYSDLRWFYYSWKHHAIRAKDPIRALHIRYSRINAAALFYGAALMMTHPDALFSAVCSVLQMNNLYMYFFSGPFVGSDFCLAYAGISDFLVLNFWFLLRAGIVSFLIVWANGGIRFNNHTWTETRDVYSRLWWKLAFVRFITVGPFHFAAMWAMFTLLRSGRFRQNPSSVFFGEDTVEQFRLTKKGGTTHEEVSVSETSSRGANQNFGSRPAEYWLSNEPTKLQPTQYLPVQPLPLSEHKARVNELPPFVPEERHLDKVYDVPALEYKRASEWLSDLHAKATAKYVPDSDIDQYTLPERIARGGEIPGCEHYSDSSSTYIVVDPEAFRAFARFLAEAQYPKNAPRRRILLEGTEAHFFEVRLPALVWEFQLFMVPLFLMLYLGFNFYHDLGSRKSVSSWFLLSDKGCSTSGAANTVFTFQVGVYMSFIIFSAVTLCLYTGALGGVVPGAPVYFLNFGTIGAEVLDASYFNSWMEYLRPVQKLIQATDIITQSNAYLQDIVLTPKEIDAWDPWQVARIGQHFEHFMVAFNEILVRTIRNIPFTMVEDIRRAFVDTPLPGVFYSYSFFRDGVSLLLLWLTGVVCLAAQVLLTDDGGEGYSQQSLQLLLVAIFSACCFLTTDILVFFVFFEMILLPLFFMIGLFGSRPERVGGAFFLLIYTLVGSLFLWPAILYFVVAFDSTSFFDIVAQLDTADTGTRTILWWCLFVGFAFKVPVVPTHLWLTVAHVEAPTVGSMLLAGLILKLGGYGILRFVCYMFPVESILFHSFVIGLCCLGYTWATIAATRQVDIKRFVAYTSISHMNFALAALFSMKEVGFGAFCHTMLSHGLIAAGMFGLVGFIYKQLAYRDVVHLSGLANIAPLFAVYWFIFSMANVGLPFFSGFPGEFFGLVALASENRFGVLCFFFGFYISAVYAFVSVSRLLYGAVRASSTGVYDLTVRSQQAFGLLGSLSVALGLLPNAVFAVAPCEVTSNLVEYEEKTVRPKERMTYCFVDSSFNSFLDDKFGLPRKPSEIFGTSFGNLKQDYLPYTVFALNPYLTKDSSLLERIDAALQGPDAKKINDHVLNNKKTQNEERELAIASVGAIGKGLKNLTLPFRTPLQGGVVIADDAIGSQGIPSLVRNVVEYSEKIRVNDLCNAAFSMTKYLHGLAYHAGPGTYHPVKDEELLQTRPEVDTHMDLLRDHINASRPWVGVQPPDRNDQFVVLSEDCIIWATFRRGKKGTWLSGTKDRELTRVLRFSYEVFHWYDMDTGQVIPWLGRSAFSGDFSSPIAVDWMSLFTTGELVRILDYRGDSEYILRATTQVDSPEYVLKDFGRMHSAFRFNKDWFESHKIPENAWQSLLWLLGRPGLTGGYFTREHASHIDRKLYKGDKMDYYDRIDYTRVVEEWTNFQLRRLLKDMPKLKRSIETAKPLFDRQVMAAFEDWENKDFVVEYPVRPISESYAAEVPYEYGKKTRTVGFAFLKTHTYKTRKEAASAVDRLCLGKAKYNLGSRYVGWSITPRHVLTNNSVYEKPSVGYQTTTWVYTDWMPDRFVDEDRTEAWELLQENRRFVQQYNFLAHTTFDPDKKEGPDGVLNLLLHRWWALYEERNHNIDPNLPPAESGYYCNIRGEETAALGDPLNKEAITALNLTLINKEVPVKETLPARLPWERADYNPNEYAICKYDQRDF